MTVATGTEVVASQPSGTPAPAPAAPVSHPSPCPSWCRDRHDRMSHRFGPTITPHRGPQVRLANPDPLPDVIPVMMRAFLHRSDEGNATGEPTMYVSGETDVALGRDEVDMFIPQMQAFLDALKVMRRQMG
jgi:hypothetical protein